MESLVRGDTGAQTLYSHQLQHVVFAGHVTRAKFTSKDSWLCTFVRTGYLGLLRVALADVVRPSLRLFLEMENSITGASLWQLTLAFPYIMHFMHLCYAKEAWWKEFHHWEMEIRRPLLLPAAISADERCSSAHWGKIPPLQSCRNGLLGLFIFHVPLLCNRGMDRKTLMKKY